MSASTIAIASGAIFGSALTLSSVASPHVIQSQFTFADFHMLLTFLSASASSAAIFHIYQSLRGKQLPQKKNTGYGYFSRYDGNIIGGAMLGVGDRWRWTE
ncbi:hypothetical protein LTR66_017081 [Elasticomyces elasticus]|nr:hypothetical protein LTR66_017081 [Elasticomyces elasticus]